VRIGTRFVATPESGAHRVYVDALLSANAEDTVLTEAFSVMWPDAPHRVLRSCIAAAEAHQADVVAENHIGEEVVPVLRFSPEPPATFSTGNVAAMALYAGESVTSVRSVQPAAEVVRELAAGAAALLDR
jgi:nitronate monooxygenase